MLAPALVTLIDTRQPSLGPFLPCWVPGYGDTLNALGKATRPPPLLGACTHGPVLSMLLGTIGIRVPCYGMARTRGEELCCAALLMHLEGSKAHESSSPFPLQSTAPCISALRVTPAQATGGTRPTLQAAQLRHPTLPCVTEDMGLNPPSLTRGKGTGDFWGKSSSDGEHKAEPRVPTLLT